MQVINRCKFPSCIHNYSTEDKFQQDDLLSVHLIFIQNKYWHGI